MGNNKTILIDLTKENRAREYKENSNATSSKTELFQYQAMETLMQRLIKEKNSIKSIKDDSLINSVRDHNAILIDAPRGAGKTSFILNIKNMLEIGESQDKLDNIFEVLDPLDPTLLSNDGNETFDVVIISHIVETIYSKNTHSLSQTKHKNFFNSLEALAESLESIKNIKQSKGIEAIINNQNSLKLEQNIHKFLQEAAKVYNKKAFILLIDDVDMAFDVGFKVLETVRKYFASPFIIPIVSGDIDLYKKVVIKEFYEKNNKNYDTKEDKLINNLVEQYLIKIFPMDRRIKLLSIKELDKENNIIIKYTDEDNSIQQIEHKKLQKFMTKYFISHNISYYDIMSDNVRAFTQQLMKLKPILHKINQFDINSEYIWGIFGISEYYQFLDALKKDISDITEDNDIYIKVFQESLKIKNNSISDTIYSGLLEKYSKSVQHSKKGYIIREALRKELYISKQYNKITTVLTWISDKDRLIFELFTYHNYYSSAKNRYMLATGKFIEFVLTTISSKDISLKDYLEKLLYSKPMLIDIADNKFIVDSDENNNNTKSEYEKEDADEQTAKWIDKLDDERIENLKEFIKPEENNIIYASYNIIYFINKYINSINILKRHHKGLKGKQYSTDEEKEEYFYQNDYRKELVDSDLLAFATRTVYILLNSIAYYEVDNPIDENIASTFNSSLDNGTIKYSQELREIIEKKSITFSKNISVVKDNKNSLTYRVYNHPLIQYILQYSENYKENDKVKYGLHTIRINGKHIDRDEENNIKAIRKNTKKTDTQASNNDTSANTDSEEKK